MSLLVHFSGPSFSQTAVLHPGAPAIVVGRDPNAGVYLPDTERVISRQHLSIQWNEGGARVDVLSRVNSLVTGRGEITSGQHVVLAAGEAAQLGHFSFTVVQGAPAAAAPAPATLPAEDPFAVFASPSSQPGGSPTTVFDDPFFQPTPAPSAPLMDTPAALAAMSSGSRPAGSFSGIASGTGGSASGINDPLAAFGGPVAPANPASLIDEFLGAPGSTGGGLGASSLLRPSPMEQAPRLAVDHVHDFNLPVSAGFLQPAPAAAPLDLDPLAALAASQAPQPAPSRDPWADLPAEWLSPPSTPAPQPHAPTPTAMEHPHPTPAVHEDPFSSSTSWRVDLGDGSIDPFSHSFVGDPSADVFTAPTPAPAEASAPAAADSRGGPAADEALAALCKGLGLGASRPQQLSAREWEEMGASVRMIVQGLTELMNVRAELKKELRAVDRTMLGAQENNPLKTGMEPGELLHYLLFMPAGAAGYMPVKAALEEAIGDLRGHEFASVAAVRAAVEGSIREFDPQKLRTALLKGRKSIALVDNARLWDLYSTFYEKKREHMADWLEQMFNRHFMPTYSRETERLRRERVQAQVQPRRH